MPFFMYYDPTYFLVLIGVVLSLLASARVKGTFNKYSGMRNSRGMTGAQAAQEVLRSAGIFDVRVEHVSGNLTEHAHGYGPLKLRSVLVPVANFGAQIAWPLILVGLLINSESSWFIIQTGILAFSLSVLFQLVTLPVEFNASGRAIRILADTGMMYGEEIVAAKKVLNAAALTYVAGAAASILQLLRLILLTRGRRRND